MHKHIFSYFSTEPLTPAQTSLPKGQLFSESYGDVYYQVANPIGESLYTYIWRGQLLQDITEKIINSNLLANEQINNNTFSGIYKTLEIGFGSGLNALLSMCSIKAYRYLCSQLSSPQMVINLLDEVINNLKNSPQLVYETFKRIYPSTSNNTKILPKYKRNLAQIAENDLVSEFIALDLKANQKALNNDKHLLFSLKHSNELYLDLFLDHVLEKLETVLKSQEFKSILANTFTLLKDNWLYQYCSIEKHPISLDTLKCTYLENFIPTIQDNHKVFTFMIMKSLFEPLLHTVITKKGKDFDESLAQARINFQQRLKNVNMDDTKQVTGVEVIHKKETTLLQNALNKISEATGSSFKQVVSKVKSFTDIYNSLIEQLTINLIIADFSERFLNENHKESKSENNNQANNVLSKVEEQSSIQLDYKVTKKEQLVNLINTTCIKLLDNLQRTGTIDHQVAVTYNQDRDLLNIYYGDVQNIVLNYTNALGANSFDSIFLDGFNPKLNLDLWNSNLYLSLAFFAKPHARITTFTSANHVKKGLEQVGFKLIRQPGFNKAEQLNGYLSCAPIEKSDNNDSSTKKYGSHSTIIDKQKYHYLVRDTSNRDITNKKLISFLDDYYSATNICKSKILSTIDYSGIFLEHGFLDKNILNNKLLEKFPHYKGVLFNNNFYGKPNFELINRLYNILSNNDLPSIVLPTLQAINADKRKAILSNQENINIFGTGISGVSVGIYFQSLGIDVKFFDKETISKASINPLGLCYPQLIDDDPAVNSLHLHSFKYAHYFYAPYMYSETSRLYENNANCNQLILHHYNHLDYYNIANNLPFANGTYIAKEHANVYVYPTLITLQSTSQVLPIVTSEVQSLKIRQEKIELSVTGYQIHLLDFIRDFKSRSNVTYINESNSIINTTCKVYDDNDSLRVGSVINKKQSDKDHSINIFCLGKNIMEEQHLDYLNNYLQANSGKVSIISSNQLVKLVSQLIKESYPYLLKYKDAFIKVLSTKDIAYCIDGYYANSYSKPYLLFGATHYNKSIEEILEGNNFEIYQIYKQQDRKNIERLINSLQIVLEPILKNNDYAIREIFINFTSHLKDELYKIVEAKLGEYLNVTARDYGGPENGSNAINSFDEYTKMGSRINLRDRFPLMGQIYNIDYLSSVLVNFKHKKYNPDNLPKINLDLLIPKTNNYYLGGMGSRGLNLAPLCATTLVQQILGLSTVLPDHILNRLNPHRLLVTSILKGKN